MVCNVCRHELSVINSRPQHRSNQVWRRRRCVLCDITYTTTEAIDYRKCLMVQTNDHAPLQPFERDRLFLSLYKSLAHRPTARADAGELCTTIIAKLATHADKGVLPRSRVIQTSLVALRRFDKLAAQHYQAFHPA